MKKMYRVMVKVDYLQEIEVVASDVDEVAEIAYDMENNGEIEWDFEKDIKGCFVEYVEQAKPSEGETKEALRWCDCLVHSLLTDEAADTMTTDMAMEILEAMEDEGKYVPRLVEAKDLVEAAKRWKKLVKGG